MREGSALAVTGAILALLSVSSQAMGQDAGAPEPPRSLRDPQAPPKKSGYFSGIFGDDPSFYPMPEIDSGKYEGTNLGILAGIVFTDGPEGQGSTLISAILAYKGRIGLNGSLDIRRDPSVDSVMEALWAQSERIENEAQLFFEDRRFADEFHARAEFHEYRRTSDRFFGRSDDAGPGQESGLTSNSYQLDLRFGPDLTEALGIQATARFREFRVGESLLKHVAQTLDVYPQEPGIQGGWVASGGIAWVYDTRDSLTVPTKGEWATLSAELAHYIHGGTEVPFWIATAEIVKLWPAGDDGQFVTVAHVKAQAAPGGDRVPFWELPALGGGTTLRSYGTGRFTNADSVLVNVEERIRLARATVFGTSGDVQVAPFFDVGKVYDSLEDLVGRGGSTGYRYSYGIGFRGVVAPHFVGRLDIGEGPSGIGVTVTIDYPF